MLQTPFRNPAFLAQPNTLGSFGSYELAKRCIGKRIAVFRKLFVALRRVDLSLVGRGGLIVVRLYDTPAARGRVFGYLFSFENGDGDGLRWGGEVVGRGRFTGRVVVGLVGVALWGRGWDETEWGWGWGWGWVGRFRFTGRVVVGDGWVFLCT